MSQVSSTLKSFSLSYPQLKEKLSVAPYHLIFKESFNHPQLFLLTVSEEFINSENDLSLHRDKMTGTIFHKETFEPVCVSFDRVSDVSEMKETFEQVYENEAVALQVMEEGTFLRLYYYEKQWLVASLRTIDTKESYIPHNGRNYSQLFREASKETIDQSKLLPDYTYCFILKHSQNRCVINYNHPAPTLVYLGKCHNKTDEKEYCSGEIPFIKGENSNDLLISRPKLTTSQYVPLLTYSDLMNSISSYKTLTEKGYTVLLKNGSRINILFSEYNRIQTLRGTNPNIKIRYLELPAEDRPLLVKYYSDLGIVNIEREIKEKCNQILKEYKEVQIYKRKKLSETGRLKNTIYQLHSLYLQTKQPINNHQVLQKLLSFSPKTIGWIMEWI